MNGPHDNPSSSDRARRGGDPHGLPRDLMDLGDMLDARGEAQRGGLAPDALERIVAMSDLQLPLTGQEQGTGHPAVIARIGPSRLGMARVWRIAAGIAVVAGLGAAVVLLARGFGSEAPAPGTLVDGSDAVNTSGESVRSGSRSGSRSESTSESTSDSARPLAAQHLERALATAKSASASAVVVALSGTSTMAHDASLHFPDLDESLAADIAPLFQAGSLLDGGGMTYEDLSSEVATIVAPGAFR